MINVAVPFHRRPEERPICSGETVSADRGACQPAAAARDVVRMPVDFLSDFLSDSEAAKYGRSAGPPSRAEMEKILSSTTRTRPSSRLPPPERVLSRQLATRSCSRKCRAGVRLSAVHVLGSRGHLRFREHDLLGSPMTCADQPTLGLGPRSGGERRPRTTSGCATNSPPLTATTAAPSPATAPCTARWSTRSSRSARTSASWSPRAPTAGACATPSPDSR